MNIIAFAGCKQSGKTTCALFVKTLFDNQHSLNYSSNIYNFADALKQNICMEILGLSIEQCYGTDDQKNELVGCYWDNKQLTAREVMQLIGTDIFRRIQNNVWANTAIKRIRRDKPDIAIIADCRFPNEVDAIKNNNGLVIKLNRNPYNSLHQSEIALDKHNYDQSNFDLVIDNHNMSIPEQNKVIYNFLLDRGLLPL